MVNTDSTFATKDEAYNQNRLGFYTYLSQPLINKIPIQWNTTTLNPDGVKPPTPNITVGQFNKESNASPLFQIEARAPYKVQYMVNKYGGHETKFGTMLHLKK